MQILRPALCCCLALFLAFTSLSLAVVRGQRRPAGEIVICTGMGLQTVAVDTDGNPVGPSHICPDGVAAIVALALTLPDPVVQAIDLGSVLRSQIEARAAGRAVLQPRSRDPPAMRLLL